MEHKQPGTSPWSKVRLVLEFAGRFIDIRIAQTRHRFPRTSLFLPAPTEVSVNANQTQELIQLSLSEPQLSVKIIGFVRQYLQVACGATSIARLRKLGRVLSGRRELLLLLSELSVFPVLH